LPGAIGRITSGPFGGLAIKGSQALHHFLVGNYYKGLEGLMPQGVSNVMKGLREGNAVPGVPGGVTNTRNDKLLDQNPLEALLTGIGLEPSSKSMQQTETSYMMDQADKFKTRLEILKTKYTNEVRDGGDTSDTVAKMNQLRQAMTEQGFRPTPLGQLLKAPTDQLIRQLFTTEGGVQFRPKTNGIAAGQLPK